MSGRKNPWENFVDTVTINESNQKDSNRGKMSILLAVPLLLSIVECLYFTKITSGIRSASPKEICH